jgi:hypothetical protein
MTIDNYINDECNIMNRIGLEYNKLMSKKDFQCARGEIKHFIQNAGAELKKEDYNKFEDYCRLVFEKYLPKEVDVK